MKNLLMLISILSMLASCSMNEPESISYPKTKKVNQTDTFFGTVVKDPYRWLENDTAKEVMAWVDAENKVTDMYLNAISYRQQLKEKIKKLVDYTRYSIPHQDGKWLYFYKNSGLQNQPVLYVQEGLDSSAKALINPNDFSKEGTKAIQATSFSKNQKYFAYSVSKAGSDWQKISILNFKTGKLLEDTLAYVKFTGISWKGDKGFYYSGFASPKNEALKYTSKTEDENVYFHKIGTPQSSDKLIYEDTAHPLRYVDCQLTEDERFLVLNISEGTDGSEIKVKDFRNPSKDWVTIVPGFNTNAYVVDNKGDNLLLYTNNNAPNYKLVEVNPSQPDTAHWKTIIPETENKLEAVTTGGGKLFAKYLKDVCSRVLQYDYDGKSPKAIRLPGLGTADGFQAQKGDSVLFYSYTSYNYPTTVFKYNINNGRSSLFYKPYVKFDPNNYETKQVFYTSKDGTKIPLFITYKKGIQLDGGNNPTMLYGYGGFNISVTPSFSAIRQVFLDHGGIYCVANIRGGGEYGEKWHKAGMLNKKQNVFDDFIAAAEYLIDNHYTNSQQLAIRGGSNGGLLVGACMTQRPDLYAVAISQVGVLDMLRYQKFTVGWGWVNEYGDSDSANQFQYLIKYSPLQNLKNGICYPATLITTGDHDDRVVPAHSFKFAATLQADQGCANPVLIRIDHDAGHGGGKPLAKVIDEEADIWSFVFYNLHMPNPMEIKKKKKDSLSL